MHVGKNLRVDGDVVDETIKNYVYEQCGSWVGDFDFPAVRQGQAVDLPKITELFFHGKSLRPPQRSGGRVFDHDFAVR